MNLAELKAALESDATKRADAQEQTIKQMREQIKRRDAKIADLEARITHHENRCATTTSKVLCVFCGYRLDCRGR